MPLTFTDADFAESAESRKFTEADFEDAPSRQAFTEQDFEPVAQPAVQAPVESVVPAAVPPTRSSFIRRAIDPAIALLGQGPVDLAQAVVGVANIPTLGAAGKAFEAIGGDFPATERFFDSLLSPEQREANRKVQEAKGIVETLKAVVSNPSTITQTIARSVPSMVGGGAIARGILGAGVKTASTAARLAAAAAGEGIISAGQTAEGIRQQTPGGMLSPLQSMVAAGSGAATGLLNILGGKAANSALGRRLGIADIEQMLAGAVTPEGKKGFVNTVVKVVSTAITEGFIEELGQSAQEQAAQNVALGKPWHEGVAQAAIQGLFAGGLMGAIAGALPGKKGPPGAGTAPPPADDSDGGAAVPPVAPPTVEEIQVAPTAPVLDVNKAENEISRKLVESGQVADSNFTVQGIKRAMGVPEDKWESEIAPMIDAGLVIRTPDGFYRFNDSIIQKATPKKVAPTAPVATVVAPSLRVSQGPESLINFSEVGALPTPATILPRDANAKQVRKEVIAEERPKAVEAVGKLPEPISPIPETQAPKGAKAVAQRIVNAEEAFLSFAMESAGLTREQALTALARYKKDKAIKIDPIGGQFSFTNGEFANPEVLQRAASPEAPKVKQPRARTAAQEFDDLVAEYGEQNDWGTDLETSATRSAWRKGPQSGSSVIGGIEMDRKRKAAAAKALFDIGEDGSNPTAKQKGEALPKLKEYLARKAAEANAPDTVDAAPDYVASADDPFANAPARPVAPLPKLRSGENQGDVFANQTEDFALVGEKGKDLAKAAEAKAKAERDAAEAKAIQDKQQQDLFAPTPTVRESKSDPGFYSRINRTVEQSPQGKATGAQWKALIRNSKLGFPQAEWDYRMLASPNALEDGTVYTKAEVLEFLKANEVVVKDVTLGNQRGLQEEFRIKYGESWSGPDLSPEESERWKNSGGKETHFSQYQLPGSVEGSYREILLTVPDQSRDITAQRESRSARWKQLKDERDRLANLPPGTSDQDLDTERKIRNTETQMDLVMRQKDEPQWRDGHSQYESIANPIVRLRYNERLTSDGKRMLFLEEVQAPQKGQFEKMPALFQKNWREIAFKWALRHATENGFDSVGWTTGTQQAERYSLSKQIKDVSLYRTSGGMFTPSPGEFDSGVLVATGKSGETVIEKYVTSDEVESYIGKEAARKLLSQPEERGTWAGGGAQIRRIKGLDLDVGGEGLKTLYDTDFRNVVNNLPAVKKSGQKVGITEITDKPYQVWHERDDGQRTLVGSYKTRSEAEGVIKSKGYGHILQYNASENHRLESANVHSLDITPEIRAAVMGGQAQFARGSSVKQPISEQAATQVVLQTLGVTELPSNIRFVNDSNPESDKGSVTYVKGQLPQITINLAKHDSTDGIKDTLVHELLHPVQEDPLLARAVGSVAALVQEADLSRKQSLGYSSDETPIEATNELIRRFYVEHANSSIFQRAVTQVVIAAKRIFRIELTARQAAVILVQDAVKNHIASAGGEALSRDPTEVESGAEVGGGTEGKITQAFNQRYRVDERPEFSESDRVLGGNYAKAVFDNIGLPTVEDANHTRMLTSEAMATPNEAAGQALLEKTAFLFNNINQLFAENNERAGVEGTWLNSIRNIIGTMKERRANGQPVAFSENLQNDLEVIAQSRASFLGMLLNSLRGMSDSILWVARNASVTLKSMRYESFGGAAVERFVNTVREHFKSGWNNEQVSSLVKETKLVQALAKFAAADEAAVSKLVKETLNTDVPNVDAYGKVFADLFAKQFGVSSTDALASVFSDALIVRIRNALIKAKDEAFAALDKKGKKALNERTPLWRRLNRTLEKGSFEFDEALKHAAENKGWTVPTQEMLDKLKALVQREQDLRTLSAADKARIDALPKAEQEAALDKAQSELDAATSSERADIIKRINTIWSKWTKPTSWNPFKSLEIAQNNAQAINEWITANILLKVGFLVRQTIDVGVQTLTHDPTRALGTAMLTHKDDFARGVFTADFWKDAGSALATTYGLRVKTVRHALAAGRLGLRGKGLIKHSEQISHRLDIFDRMMQTSERLAKEGKTQQAFALRLVTYVRSSLLFSRAMDLLSVTGAEYAEIAHRIRTVMKTNGKSNAEISQQLDLIFGDMKAQWVEAYARAQQIFAEKGITPDKAALDEAAGSIIRARAYTALKVMDKDSGNFQEVAEDMANTIGWNEREVGGVGGLVGGLIRGVQRTGEKAGIPTAFISAFGNAIAIGINRKLTWMGLGKLAGGKESPWYRTELDREQRLAEGFIGVGVSAFMVALAMTGAIVVRGFWPKDEKEREKWRIEGRRGGTVEIPTGDGKFITLSLSVGPIAMMAPTIVAAGALRNLLDERVEKQTTADKEAAKRGVAAAKIDPPSVGEIFGVAADAFKASLINSRTLSGFIGGTTDAGQFEPKKLAATIVADVIPPIPGWQDMMRTVGVYMNPRLATFGDMLIPLPTSGARRLNVLGDSSGTFDQVQQIIQTLTGGNYPFPIDPGIAKKQPAYAALFAADTVPAPWQPGKGVVINGVWRPLSQSELHKFIPLQGKLFATELNQVSSEILSLPKEEGRKLVREAHKRATEAALERIGVDVEASKAPSTATGPSRAARDPSLASSVREYSGSARVSSVRDPSASSPASERSESPRPRSDFRRSGSEVGGLGSDRETSFTSTRSSGGGRLRGVSRRRGGGRRLRTATTRRTRTRKIRLSKPRTTPFKTGRLRTRRRRKAFA